MKWAQPKECAGPYCDRKFYPSRSDALYCGDTCRQQAHRQRKANTALAKALAVTPGQVSSVTAPTEPGSAVTDVTAKSPVTVSVTANPVEGDLDAEIAELVEQIRRALWWSAAMRWHSHHEEPWTPPFEDDDRPVPGQIYAWQHAIDTGHVQPVTKYVLFADFDAPDLPWPGLGLDNRDVHLSYQDWWTV